MVCSIRVAGEPANRDGFVLTVERYTLGDLEFATNPRFDSGINGTAYIFNEDRINQLPSWNNILYKIPVLNQEPLFANKDDAVLESDTEQQEKLLCSAL